MSLPNAQPVPTGFDNYTELVNDPSFVNSVQVSFTFVFVAVLLEFCLGIALALLVTLRTALMVPIMMTPVVVGVLWRTLFNSSYGVINYLLSLVHVPPQLWLGSPSQALPAVIVVEIWQGLPVVTFIVAAGIQALPLDIFEQARIDGASSWQIFRSVTLPLLRPVLLVVLLLRIMDAFKTFDIIYTLTQGGPGEATNVLSMLIYKVGLQFFQIGQAAAMSWVFLAFITAISVVFVWQIQRVEAI
jgi:multiple sugar transport system permease protein